MKNYDKIYPFYRTRHPFSNWHPATFEEKGRVFNCTEQYMMYRKATMFGDYETADKIMEAREPRDQKALGRTVRNFNSKVWNENARQIVYEGCLLKFSQNPKLKDVLMSTKGSLLAEAATNDLIWGVGLSEDDARIHDVKNWTGTNWLGEVLTNLREYFEDRDPEQKE